MPRSAKFLFFIFVFTLTASLYLAVYVKTTKAQVPGIKFPCDEESEQEFHSLRPYQASPCGDAGKALYCSNELRFVESFNLSGRGDCQPRNVTGSFSCDPDFHVEPHNLYISLDESMFPILGNTENVKNSQNASDEIDNATKVNEYASWYLGGVDNKAEYGETAKADILNFSGPLKKLLPSAIQDAQRIKSIEQASKTTVYDEDPDEGGAESKTIEEAERHNQIVVCTQNGKPVECYDGSSEGTRGKALRLKDWEGNLSLPRSFSNQALDLLNNIPGLGGILDTFLSEAWNDKKPPLPWDEDENENPKFKSSAEYLKAYSEWRGKSCAMIPVINYPLCFDNPFITNQYANLFPYIPLSSTVDKKGAEYILGDGPSFTPSGGTEIANDQFTSFRNAPLYFAHTQEVKDLSELLNTTYTPQGFESKPLTETTEENYCSVANVRTNSGDDLFPGDPDEMQVLNVEYDITQVECHEVYEFRSSIGCGKDGLNPCITHTFKCPAEVTISLPTNTKTPWADEIFASTVADSGSTFRKIYPKVGSNAPVYCIADMPTTTKVIYDAEDSEPPRGGSISFKVKRNPKDSGADTPELTFPHIGSVYEYFLSGIQTALRPKGYGEQVINGNCQTCGELPNLPQAGGSCTLGSISSRAGDIPQSLKDIIEAASETYKVPPNLILGIMYGEGLFNPTGTGANKESANPGLPWSDYSVKNWATCSKVPNCNDGEGDDGFLGFYSTEWANIEQAILPELEKLVPGKAGASRCNLLDAIYGLAWNLHDSADGGGGMDFQCFGLDLIASAPSSCTWNPNQYISAIKVAENGYEKGCFTKPGSCAGGRGNAALCDTGIDTCEKYTSAGNTSHMACLWDVAHGN